MFFHHSFVFDQFSDDECIPEFYPEPYWLLILDEQTDTLMCIFLLERTTRELLRV